MDKRGVSQIVTTILIILLVLAAIVIVWQAVKSTVEGGAGTIEAKSGCIGFDLSIETATCTRGGGLAITITRGADNIDGDQLTATVIDSTGSSKTATKSISSLGSVNFGPVDFSLPMFGATTTINTGLTLDDGVTMCQGPKKTIDCTVG